MARTVVVGAAVATFASTQAAFARGKRAVPELRRDVEKRLAQRVETIARVQVAVHVTQRDGKPVADRATFEASLERANELLRPHGIEVEVVSFDSVPINAQVHSLQARRQLARHAPPGRVVHVFVVDTLEREHRLQLGNPIRGLYWRSAGLGWIRGRHWISITTAAPRSTFAHELGHLLGLRHHRGEHNVMCSCRSGSGVGFLPTQGSRMRTNAELLTQDAEAAMNWSLHRRRASRFDR